MYKNSLSRIFCVALFAIIAIFISSGSRAELVFQPGESEIDEEWRSAGSSLLEGMSIIFESLAALEKKDSFLFTRKLRAAKLKLVTTKKEYEILISHLESPREINLNRLTNQRRNEIFQAFKFYGIIIPDNEADVAKLAADETLILIQFIEDTPFHADANNLKKVQSLLSLITRILRVGTYSAEMMAQF